VKVIWVIAITPLLAACAISPPDALLLFIIPTRILQVRQLKKQKTGLLAEVAAPEGTAHGIFNFISVRVHFRDQKDSLVFLQRFCDALKLHRRIAI
jgi:hypothetical protein